MNSPTDHPENELGLKALIRIHRICQDFEQTWQRGELPRIEDYLGDTPDPERRSLLRELLLVELHYREARGETVACDEYRQRFADCTELVDDTFDEWQQTKADSAVSLLCPFCGVRVEWGTSQALEVTCQNCHGTFHITPPMTGSPHQLPASIGRYQNLELIGRGAFGTVLKAHDPDLDRTVAVKILRAASFATEEEVVRFEREARVLGQLNHPGIVRVYDVGRHEGVPYIVMEFFEHQTLQQLLQKKRLDFRSTAELVARLAESLECAHAQDVVHRDVKPGNILIDPFGQPHVTDFGLARRGDDKITVTQDGQMLGTPAYMSPEQARGDVHKIDARTDIYSLGVVLYEMLTGQRPFLGSPEMVRQQLLDDEPKPPRALNKRIPRDLETICLKCLEKTPASRYASAQELADDLLRFVNAEPIRARRVTALRRTWRWCRRRPARAALVAASLVLLFVGAYALARDAGESRRLAAAASQLLTELGHTYQQGGDLEKALSLYTRAIAQSPRLAVAYANRAGALRQLGRLGQALEDCRQAIELDPNLGYAYMNRGNVLRDMARTDEALADYAAALEREPNNARIFLNRGVLYYHQKRLDQALADYDSAIRLDPNLALAYTNRGNVYLDRGQTKQATRDYEQAISLDPTSHLALFNYAILHRHEGRLADAVTYLNRAIYLAPREARYYKARGDVYRDLGDKTRAASDYDRAIEYDPSYVDALINRGGLFIYDDPQRALEDFQQALRLQPHNVTAITNAGVALTQLKQYQEALEYHSRAIALDGESWLAYSNRGLTFDAMGQFEKAVEDFTRSLAIKPDAETHMNLGNVYFAARQCDKALAEYSAAIGLEPRRASLYHNRAACYAQAGDFQNAVHDCDRAIELDQGLAMAYVTRASAKNTLGKVQEALADFDRAIQLGASSGQLHNNRGNLFRRLGDLPRALEEYSRAIGVDPDFAPAYNGRAAVNLDLGAPEEALRDIERAIQLDPDESNYHNTRGNALQALGRYAEAIPEYNIAINASSNESSAWMNRGITHQRLQRYDQALADYNHALAIVAENDAIGRAFVLLNRAALRFEQQDYDQAVADMEEAGRQNPEFTIKSHAMRGLIDSQRGQLEEAIEQFVTLLAIDPLQGRAYVYLSELELSSEKFDLALRDALMAKARNLVEPDDLYRLARVFAQLAQRVEEDSKPNRACLEGDALTLLHQAIDKGFRDRQRLESDDVWDALSDRPEFHEALAKLSAE